MDNPLSLNQLGQAAQITPPQQSASAQMMGGAIASDFETFLRMLTVQMQNQDPLNPIESTDYAVQLATFSTLEQQALTNKILSTMMAPTETTPMMALNDWVGLSVTAERSFFHDGSPVTMSLPDLSNSQTGHLIIKNEQGVIVDAQTVEGDDTIFVWQNDELPEGTYRAEVNIFEGEELLGTKNVLIQGKVEEAQWRNGQIQLLFSGDISIPAQSVVTAIAKSEKH